MHHEETVNSRPDVIGRIEAPLRDRRREERTWRGCERIEWKPVKSAEARDSHTFRGRGWLNDVSPSGLSFLAPKDEPVHVGDELTVSCDGEAVPCRVMWISHNDWAFTLLGCQKLSPSSQVVRAAA